MNVFKRLGTAMFCASVGGGLSLGAAILLFWKWQQAIGLALFLLALAIAFIGSSIHMTARALKRVHWFQHQINDHQKILNERLDCHEAD